MKLAGLEPRAQPELSVAVPVDRSEEASRVDPEGLGLQLTGPDGPVDPLIVVRTADIDPQFSGVQVGARFPRAMLRPGAAAPKLATLKDTRCSGC